MSTILKALKRLEEEKSTPSDDAPLREELSSLTPGEPNERTRGTRLTWLAIGAFSGLLAIAAFVWWQRPSLPPEPDLVATPVAQEPRPVREARAPAPTPPPQRRAPPPVARPAPTPPPVAARPAPAPAATRPAPQVAATESPAPPPTPIAPPEPVAETTLPTPAPVPDRAERAVPESVAAPPKTVPEPVVASKPEAVVAPKPEPSPAAKAAPPPKPAAKPPARLARVAPPAVRVERTIWHPNPERRRALVRVPGRDAPVELREGDAASTLVVRSIEPSAVVFLFGDRELRRKVGGK